MNGYEGLYQVSSLGRVKALKREVNCGLKNIKSATKRERILKQSKNTQDYYFVNLCRNNIYQIKTIHRLVAEAFIPNINNLEQVNHIDGNKHNNKVNNLEWCTRKHNIREAWRLGLVKQGKGKDHPESIAVNQYDLKGSFIRRWDSMMDIQREKGFLNVCICNCCKGKQKTSYGYIWKYAEKAEEK